jgi:hypothetical protein
MKLAISSHDWTYNPKMKLTASSVSTTLQTKLVFRTPSLLALKLVDYYAGVKVSIAYTSPIKNLNCVLHNDHPSDETHGIQHRGFKHLPLRIRCKMTISIVGSINHQTISLRNGSEKRQERRKVPGVMLESLSDCRYGASRIFTLFHGQRNGQDHSTTEIHTLSFMLVSFLLRP